METTRLALEKLTASEEYKRFEAKKKEQKRQAVSRSLMDAYIEDDHSGDEVGPDADASNQLRHNLTMMPMAGGLDDESES